jgi:glycosyltransferase involved in cell wall biosynthesis
MIKSSIAILMMGSRNFTADFHISRDQRPTLRHKVRRDDNFVARRFRLNMNRLSSDNDSVHLRREIVRLRFQLQDANARAEIALSKLEYSKRDNILLKIIPVGKVTLLGRVLNAALSSLSRLRRALRASGSSKAHKSPEGDIASHEDEKSEPEQIRLRADAIGPAMLFITHGRGGGTDRHIQEMRTALERAGIHTFILRSNPRRQGVLKFDAQGLGSVLDRQEFFVPHDVEALVHAIHTLDIKHIHVQHLADAGNGAEKMVRAAAHKAGIQYDVTVHDYFSVCPRITLIGASGVYCGEPESAVCNACLKISRGYLGTTSIELWRESAREFLSHARSVFVPSPDVSDRMQTYFPQINYTVRPHFTAVNKAPHAPIKHRTRRRIATLGVLSPQKGAGLLLECAKYAATHDLPIEFVVIGYSSRSEELISLPNVKVTGAYQEQDLDQILQEHRPDIAWFPSLLPETFSYTLSAALGAGIFPVTFDLGAPARRLSDLAWGAVMPLEYMLSVPDIVQYLLTTPIASPPPNLAQSATVFYESILLDYYGHELNVVFRPLRTTENVHGAQSK